MIVREPSRLAVDDPRADLAVLHRLRIVRQRDDSMLERNGCLELLPHQPEIRGVVIDTILVMRRDLVRCDDVKEFRTHTLEVAEHLGVEPELEDGTGAGLPRKLRVGDFVRPVSQLTRLVDSTENVRLPEPAAAQKAPLHDDFDPGAHRGVCLNDVNGPLGWAAEATQVDNLEALSLERSDIGALVLEATLDQEIEKRVSEVRACSVAERGGHVERGAVAAAQEVREVRGGKGKDAVEELHWLAKG
jgi:hypothetical protein